MSSSSGPRWALVVVLFVALLPVAWNQCRELAVARGRATESAHHRTRGLTAAAAGETTRAVVALQRAVDLAPDDAASLAALRDAQARVLARQPDAANADAAPGLAYDLEVALESGPAAPELYDVALGNLALASGQEDRAAKLYQKAMERNAGEALGPYYLGNLLLRQGKDDEAIAHLGKAAGLDPKAWRVQAALGVAYNRQKKWALAAEALTKAAEIQPGLQVWSELGRARLEQKQFADAADALSKALALTPQGADAAGLHEEMGFASFSLQKYDEAVKHLDAAFQANHKAETYFSLGVVLQAKGEHAKAAGIFKTMLAEDATLADAHVRLVLSLVQMGQADAARQAAERFGALAAGRRELAGHVKQVEQALAQLPAAGGKKK